MQLLNEPDDLKWLKETHLKGFKVPEFKSFVIHGQESGPDRIDLFSATDPNYLDSPVATYVSVETDAGWTYARPTKLSKWIVVNEYCATRVIRGTNPEDVANRIAFIEKSPRVLLNGEWVYGPKGSGGSGDPEKEQNYGFYPRSREWADEELRKAGFDLED
jgi:hypothetical protein